jgi:hypothetical protein
MKLNTLLLLIAIHLSQINSEEWWMTAGASLDTFQKDIACKVNTSTTTKRCSAELCMEIWIEDMPQEWLDSGRSKRAERHAPQWSPMENIECTVTINTMNSCSCVLPAQTARSSVIDMESIRTVFIGDSTVRNFRTFFSQWLKYRSYSSLSVDRTFQTSFEDFIRKCFVDSMRGGPPDAYIAAMSNYHNGLKDLPSGQKTIWRTQTESARSATDTPCMHFSHTNSSLMWLSKSYEELAAMNFRSTAREMCLKQPQQPVAFVLTAGLHYIPVLPTSLVTIYSCQCH